MPVYLVQHGLSAPKEVDPTRGLTEAGRAETERIAKVAAGYKIEVSTIVHSGKKRAEQTAEILRNILKVEPPLTPLPNLNPMDDVTLFSPSLHPASKVLVVGHLPYLDRLVSFLTAGSEDSHVYQFQNSGILCLEADGHEEQDWNWFIKWTLNPNIG